LGRNKKNLLAMNLAKAVKKMFPRTFLKHIFLVYNKIKDHTWDKLFFAATFIPNNAFLIRDEKNPFLELQIDLSSFKEKIKNKFAIWSDPSWKQDQYLLFYDMPAYIEPKVGWAVSPQRKLIYASLGFSRAAHVRKPSWFETYFKKGRVIELGQIISLRDTGEENYFHFFNDVLPKLFFLQENGFDLKKYTLVVAERLYKKKYFRYYLKNTFLRSLTWHVQGDEWIRFGSAVFCKPYTHTLRFFNQAIGLVGIPFEDGKERKVFLTRNKISLRHLQNAEVIIELMRSHDFEIIDASEITFEEQVKLFQHTRHLIAIHGAGVTNIVFRRGRPLSFLEIVPSMEYIPFHYIMLAKQFNYKYSIILGSRIFGDGSFDVSSDDVKRYLEQLNVS
jgi:hypothetical protein